jgi:Uma2 family endonuclease
MTTIERIPHAPSVPREGTAAPTAPSALPPLENGDHLTRPEFERRYHAMPHLKKAELIEGKVYMGSPVSIARHSEPHFNLITWLGTYRAQTPGVIGADNGSVRLDLDNMPQPDAFLMILPEHGGQARISPDDYLEGASELVVEIAASSASYDLHEKLDLYRRHGVREYLVWRVLDETIDWLALREGRYESLTPGKDGLVRSEVFPGLWLNTAALLSGELGQALQALQQGLATPEHAAFAARLSPVAEGTA